MRRRGKTKEAPAPEVEPVEQAPPFVSVLIPVLNEETYIGPCLQALAQQDYPRERCEVIVLDGKSTDGTAPEAEQTAREVGVPDVFLTNQKRTTASGLNLGLSIARGEVIIRVDGHTLVEPDFISASVRALGESGADAVGGPIRTKGRGAIGQAIALVVSSPYGVGDATFRYSDEEQWTDSVAFAAYRREVFDRVGVFDETMNHGEDDEFNYRLRESGGRILLTPAIGSIYYARASYMALARQYWRYGMAKARVLRRHPERLRPRHLAPSALVLAVTGFGVLSLVDRRFRRPATVVGGMYQNYVLASSFRLARAGGHWRLLPFLPPAFVAMHIAAGAGLIAGFAREAIASRGKGEQAGR